MRVRRRLLIRRDYQGYAGGHGKFRDYVAHIDAHPDWQALVHQTPESVHDASNPFDAGVTQAAQWDPGAADALLLGGMDWAALPHTLDARIPVINLVQHVRHAVAGSPLRGFLGRRAVRICVSSAVTEALTATGEVNGPLHTVPAGVDTDMLARVGALAPSCDVFVDAVKHPQLGQAVADALQRHGLHVWLQAQRSLRPDYLQRMAMASVVVTLPDPTEGLYLPGLEALAMGRTLVQPDCVGARQYIRPGDNALMPARDVDALVSAAMQAHTDARLRDRLATTGQADAKAFDLAGERRRVHAILDNLDAVWAC